MAGAAFFISPNGDLIRVSDRHIRDVVAYPEKFGLTREYVEDIHKKHGEKLGSEGNAREEILTNLVKKGWIRIREYANKYWSVQVPNMGRKVKEYLWDFAVKVVEHEPPFHLAKVSPYDGVRIHNFRTNGVVQYTFKALAGDVLFTSSEIGRLTARSSLQYFEGIYEFSSNTVLQMKEL